MYYSAAASPLLAPPQRSGAGSNPPSTTDNSLITNHQLAVSSLQFLTSLRQIHHNRITRFDQILRRDHDLLAPLTRSRAEHGFVQQARFEESSESLWLSAKGGDRADDISRCFLYGFRLCHLNIA